MSGVTLSDLSKYHQGAMKWFKDGLVSEHNRLFAQTEEAGAVSFWPLGGTPLEGKVKFSFKEVLPAEGDKSPTNPSGIFGTSSIYVRIANKNLLPVEYTNTTIKNGASFNHSGGTYIENNNGIYFLKLRDGFSSTTGLFNAYIMRIDFRDLYLHAGTYTLSGYTRTQDMNSGQQIQFQINKLNADGTVSIYRTVTCTNGSATFTLTEDSFINVYVRTPAGTVFPANGFTCTPQLEIGSEATPFEPGELHESVLSLGNTYYGGEIDLATGVMTVTWEEYVVTGQEGWSAFSFSETSGLYDTHYSASGRHRMSITLNNTTRFCSHFPFSSGSVANSLYTWQTNWRVGFRLSPDDFPDLTTFKTWLASEYSDGHPVTIVYKLEEPYTIQLTPLQLTALAQKDKYTPRMNTVYTDADSIQIRYRKSLIHDEDEKVQAIVALGGNV